jgi:hypothetical protein
VILLCFGIGHGFKELNPIVVLYWLSASALWLSEIHRKDIARLVIGSPLLIILCVYYLQSSQQKSFKLGLQALSISSVCLAGATLTLALLAPPMDTRAGRVHVSVYDPVIPAIEEHVMPGGDIFIYPYAPMYYFLSATNNPTRYSTLTFNVKVGSEYALDEVTRDLEKRRVKYVLWDEPLESMLGSFFPGARAKRFVLAPYLESHYRQIWVHEGIRLMERKK